MKKKKSGSILVEGIVALFMVLIISIVGCTASINLYSSLNKRIAYERLEEIMYAVINEVKYNMEFDFLKEKLNKDTLKIDMQKDLLKILEENNIEELIKEGKGDIEVSKVESSEEYLLINIKIENNGKVIEKQILKGKWMNEV